MAIHQAIQRVTWAVSGLALALSANVYAGGEAIAQTQASQTELAQVQRECRRVNRQIGVYVEPNVASDSLGILPASEVVVLGNGSGSGWARIIHPAIGWVDARNLANVRCPADLANLVPPVPFPQPAPLPPAQPSPTPQPGTPVVGPEPTPFPRPDNVTRPTQPDTQPGVATGNQMCAVVTYEGTEGLAIRDRPDASADSIGSLRYQQPAVELTGAEFREPSGRLWVQIVGGGWVAATGPIGVSSGTNLEILRCNAIQG